MLIEIEIEQETLAKIDEAAKMTHKSRTDFVENALNEAIIKVNKTLEIAEKENRTIEAYRKFPQKPEEYEIWQDEQVWED